MKKRFLSLALFASFACSLPAVTPDRYLEYVQSTADLYVDIDYIPKSTSVIETQVAFMDIARNNTIFCCRRSDATTFTLFYIYDSKPKNGYFRWDYTNADRKSGTFVPVADTIYYLRASGDGLYAFGQYAESTTKASFTPGTGTLLFASYKAGASLTSGLSNYARMKMYSFKAYDYDADNRLVLSRDLVPAELDGVVGLYDRVSGAFYSSGTAKALVAGPEITLPATVSLREDVLDRGYAYTPGGITSTANSGKYGYTNLFDGVRYTTATNQYAMDSRWIGNDDTEQYVDVENAYFQTRSGALMSYVVYKCSMNSYAINARAPVSWRLEGVLATSASDDDWTVIDTQTDVAWPSISTYVYDKNEAPPSKENCSLTFAVNGAKQAPYRRLRFVPLDSMSKRYHEANHTDDQNLYALLEVDFQVLDADPGMASDTVVVSADPDIYGEPSPAYGTLSGINAGDSFPCSIPEISFANADGTLRAICTGWKIYAYNDDSRTWAFDADDPASQGSGHSFTYTHPSPAVARKVEWQFQMQAYVDATALGDGSATGSGWYDLGATAALSASASGTSEFKRWEGLPDGVDASSPSATFTVTGPVAATARIGGVRYVAKSGDDFANDGLYAESPFLTINHAVADLGAVGGTVYVDAGSYTETNGTDLAAINLTNQVALVGTTGNAQDVRVTMSQTGATRHVLLINNPYASAQFMTFKGGRATTNSWGNSDSGMNVRIGANGGVLEDCTVSDASGSGWNQHGLGLFLYGGRASRCLITQNSSTSDNSHGGAGLGANAGLVEDCLIVSNSCLAAGAVYLTGTAKMVNCTIAGNSGSKYAGVYCDSADARIVNCAIFENTAKDTPEGPVYRGTTTGFIRCASDLEIPNSVDCLVGQSGFVDSAHGDYRPGVSSLCLDAGTARADYGAVSTTDFAANPRIVGDAVDIGCYENQRDELECGFTWSADSLIAPASVTLAATSSQPEDSTYAWTLRNETIGATTDIPASADATYVFTTADCGLYSVVLTVTAGGVTATHELDSLFRIGPKDLYADVGNATPEFPYDTRAKASTDIASAIEAAVDGSTVHVAGGTYEIGAALAVSKGIAVIGEAGRPSGVVVRRTSGNVRNLTVNHPDAWVANMTFADGQIAGHGGCVYINGRGGTVTNCVLTHGRTTANNDYTGGGAVLQAGLLTHCEIVDCTAVHKNGGSASRTLKLNGGRASNCLLHGNVADYTGSLVYVASGAVLENCTLVDNVVSTGSLAVEVVKGGTIRNCAIFVRDRDNGYASCGGKDEWASFWPLRFQNCVTKEAIAEYTTGNGGKGWYTGYNCVTNVTEESCFVDFAAQNYKVAKTGPLYNAGTNGVGVLPAVDYAGHPRMNGDFLDVGCYEFFSDYTIILLR